MPTCLSLSFSNSHTDPSIIPLSLTLINMLSLPALLSLSLSSIYPSIHHPCWPAQVITNCDDGFVPLISLIIVVSYNLVLCRDLMILLWLYLTLALSVRMCVIPLCPWLTSTLHYTHIVPFSTSVLLSFFVFQFIFYLYSLLTTSILFSTAPFLLFYTCRLGLKSPICG